MKRGMLLSAPRTRRTIPLVFVALLVAIGALAGTADMASGHAELLRGDPPADGALAVPPSSLDLWFSEPVATGGGSPAVQLVDQSGAALPAIEASVDPADSSHVSAEAPGLAPGTYTLLWTARSATDGHTLGGSFAFRVGSGRAPGVATVAGERPRVWAAATRWLSFLGAAFAAGGFAFALVILHSTRGFRLRLISGAAATGLIATLAEPWLQTRWPPAGIVPPSLRDSINGLPLAWWLRPGGLLIVLIGIALASMNRGRLAAGLGLAGAFTALLSLSLTSHAAGREHWRWVAASLDLLHVVSAALWAGGLAHLALWWRTEPARNGEALRRFSRAALALVAIAIGAGVANAGFLLPALRSLWSSGYGQTLLVKVAVLVLPLALATFNRRAIGRIAAGLRPALRRSVRLEAMLVLAVVLAGSILAVSAPPRVEAEKPAIADVPMPAIAAHDGQDLLVHLRFTPGRSGENALTVQLTNYDRTPYAGEQPALVRLRAISLGSSADSGPIDLAPAAEGWSAPTTALSFDGWWRLEATLRWLGQDDVVVPFVLILPDPNLNSLDAPGVPPSDPAAASRYETAMARYTGMHRVRFTKVMASHSGFASLAVERVNDGADGSTPGFTYVAEGGWEYVVLGETGWTKLPGKDWRVDSVNPMIPPSEWDEEYIGATGFQFGRVEPIDGEPCQIVTFVVPGSERQVVAYYAWWIGVESGALKQEMMISKSHYMATQYFDVDAPITIAPPPDAPTAAATPAA